MTIAALSGCRVTIRVEEHAFNMADEWEEVRVGSRRGDVGAMVSFVGLCRDEGGEVAALEIEHFPDMAQAEIGRIAALAAARFPLLALHIVHRYGVIAAGEEIVLVIASSAHRRAAFEAAEFVMDYLKTDAPFWKKQHWHEGQGAKSQQSDWVMPKLQDFERRLR